LTAPRFRPAHGRGLAPRVRGFHRKFLIARSFKTIAKLLCLARLEFQPSIHPQDVHRTPRAKPYGAVAAVRSWFVVAGKYLLCKAYGKKCRFEASAAWIP
jgi:hypothetical protein